MIKSYKDLVVWQKSVDLVVETYKLTKLFPKEEMFGLTSQMRRSSVSVASNIAEGFSRKYNQGFKQFIRIALGSGAELETQIILSDKLKLVDSKNLEKASALVTEVMKMLNSLNKYLTINHKSLTN